MRKPMGELKIRQVIRSTGCQKKADCQIELRQTAQRQGLKHAGTSTNFRNLYSGDAGPSSDGGRAVGQPEKASKAEGRDETHPVTVKTPVVVRVKRFARLLRPPLDEGQPPANRLNLTVMPVHNDKDRCRPASLTTSRIKILEGSLRDRIVNYWEVNKLMKAN